jgi:hypothetical protein
METVRTEATTLRVPIERVMDMVGVVILGLFVLLAVVSALGWVADSREPARWFGSPHE